MFLGILVLAQSYIWTLFECRGPSSLTEINKRPHNPADIFTLKQKVQSRSCAVTKLHWLRCCSIGRLDALARSFYLERGHFNSDSVTTPEGLEIRKDIFTALFKTTRIRKYKANWLLRSSLPSIILADLLGNKVYFNGFKNSWFAICGFKSVLCVFVFQGSLLEIVTMIDGSEKRNCEGGFWTSERVFEKCSKTLSFLSATLVRATWIWFTK